MVNKLGCATKKYRDKNRGEALGGAVNEGTIIVNGLLTTLFINWESLNLCPEALDI